MFFSQFVLVKVRTIGGPTGSPPTMSKQVLVSLTSPRAQGRPTCNPSVALAVIYVAPPAIEEMSAAKSPFSSQQLRSLAQLCPLCLFLALNRV